MLRRNKALLGRVQVKLIVRLGFAALRRRTSMA